MKKRLTWMVMLAAMLCMICGMAMAESMPEVHIPTAQEIRERFYFPQPPEGVVLDEPVIRDGFIQIVINAEKTNFDMLSFPQQGLIDFPMMIKAPADGNTYTRHNCIYYGPGIFTDEGAIGIGRTSRIDDGNVFPCSINMMGTMDTNRMMFLPESETAEESTWHMIRWLTEDGTEKFEKLIVQITYSGQVEPVYIPMSYVTEEMLAPMGSLKEDDFFQKVEIEDGELHLYMSEKAGFKVIPLVLNTPDGAAAVRIAHDFDGDVTEASVQNGQVTLYSNSNPRLISCNNHQMLIDNHYDVTWLDQNGKAMYTSKLTINVIPYENKPLFNYVSSSKYEAMQNIQAIDISRLRVQNNMANCGVQWSYDQQIGMLRIFRDVSAKVTGEPGALTGYVQPENKAWKYARISTVGGSAILGPGKFDMAYEQLEHFTVHSVSGNGLEIFSETPLERYKAGPVQVYLQSAPYQYGGGAILVAWYENEDDPWDQPAQMEYIHLKTEELFVEADGVLLPHGTAITGPVDQITVVMPKGYEQKWKDWKLVIRYDPQMGVNALHYEIYGTNETGAFQKIDLDEEVALYMPYPEGKNHHSKDTFYLYHFNDLYQQKEKLEGEKTPYGVLYHVKSFSPFVLEWVPESTARIPDATDYTDAHVTEDLRAVGMTSRQVIRAELLARVLQDGFPAANTVLYELQLVDEAGNPVEPVQEDFPLQFLVSLPEGSTANDLFIVKHMFASNAFGRKAGDVETCAAEVVYQNGTPMLRFSVSSLSPVMIAWMEQSAAAGEDVPKTGDSAHLGIWTALLLLSAAGAAYGRKRA